MRTHIWMWAGLMVLAGVSCVQILDGEHPYRPGDTSVEGQSCRTGADCDDKNPCTTDSCSPETLICDHVTQTDGLAPDSAQTAADCKRVQCMSGKPVDEEDPLDVLNDNNSCTTDSCSAGMPINEVIADGMTCTQGSLSGTCAGGSCKVSCAMQVDCDDGNPCTDDLCNTATGMCAYTDLDGVPTPGAPPVVGDCKLQFCVNGVNTEVNDDADVMDDGNPCTEDLCAKGAPQNDNIAAGTACTPGDAKVCDGNGACVDCTVASHCVNITETECEKRSCVNNTCQIAYEGTSTLASPVLQTAGDCKKVVCNGNMGTTTLPDDADLPNDNNLCTTDTCSNGNPTFVDKPQGTNCGTNQVCSATGICVGCNSPSDCQGTDTFCQTRTCNNNVCGVSNTPNGTDLPSADQTAGDCKVRECNGTGGIKTTAQQSDIPVDGNPCTQDLCNALGNPSNPPTAVNSPCNVGGNDACDGAGTCKKSLGKTCGGGTECVSTRCVDGVCCDSACTTLCRACNVAGNLGTCTDVPKGQDDGTCTGANQSCNGANDCDDENGQACASNDACLSGFCADGVCCESACNTACKSCNVAGGTPGVCGNLPAMSQDNAPTNLCVGLNQCDGNGVCKKVTGAPCSTNSECLNNFCVDGYCCNTACTATCQACNIIGLLGTCSNLPQFDDDNYPANACNASNTCNGAGVCKKKDGQLCMQANECAGGYCFGGFCTSP